MMERAEDTIKKRRQMIIDNEEAVQSHRQEMYRQGHGNYTNTEQSENERYINVKYKGGGRPASTYRQQFDDIRSLRSKPA